MTVVLLLIALLFQQPAQQPSRPTEPKDPMPPPNLDYYVGAWSFDWNLPETPLGPAGKMKGTETYKKILSGQKYESEIQGDGPEGPFQGRAITSYDEKEKLVARYEIFSYGVSAFKSGTIDRRRPWRLLHDLLGKRADQEEQQDDQAEGQDADASPAHYRVFLEISVDGGPFMSLGNPWFRKVDDKPPG